MSDFVDADQDLDEPADEWPLRDLILAQGLLGTAIPVLLFTSTQLAAATSPPAGHHHLSVDADADGVGAALVARTATDVGLVPDRVA
ncbi:hypothetical protein, partial [Escherichia coli]|uniref:hypothetical protein n=1 Tax=Escherichia coli TaxID=562 RepID=UPI00106FB924